MLYKLWRFLDVYCGIDSLLVRSVREYDQYSSFVHALSLFCLAFTRNLWVTSFDEFLRSAYFERKDVLGLVKLLRALIIDLVLGSPKAKHPMDGFALYAASALLRLLHEQFAVADFVDPRAWDITEVDWAAELQRPAFSPEVTRIIGCMPECIPFEVRATLFQQTVKAEVARYQHQQKMHVRVRRAALFEDGY